VTSRNKTRSGAGRDVSGARHHSYVSVVVVVVEVGEELVMAGLDGVVVVVPSFEEEEGRDLAAENAMPENAYLSQMIFVPASSSLIIVSLRNMRVRILI
jgi:hypothetical protein